MFRKTLSFFIVFALCLLPLSVSAESICVQSDNGLPYGLTPELILEMPAIEVNQVNPVIMFLLLENTRGDVPGPARICALLHMRYGLIRTAMVVDGQIHDYALDRQTGCFVDTPINPRDQEFLGIKLTVPPKAQEIES